MAFTSGCWFAGNQWDGPTGCPIISPSNWTTYVLNNLCVLALHDHGAVGTSASAGEGKVLAGSLFPALDYDHFSGIFPIASTNWTRETRGTYLLNFAVATSTQSATIDYDIYIRSGTYKLTFLAACGSAMGVITACVNGSSIGTVDRYKSGVEENIATYANVAASLSFTSSGAGEKKLTFTADTKNTNSAGFIARINSIQVLRTGN